MNASASASPELLERVRRLRELLDQVQGNAEDVELGMGRLGIGWSFFEDLDIDYALEGLRAFELCAGNLAAFDFWSARISDALSLDELRTSEIGRDPARWARFSSFAQAFEERNPALSEQLAYAASEAGMRICGRDREAVVARCERALAALVKERAVAQAGACS